MGPKVFLKQKVELRIVNSGAIVNAGQAIQTDVLLIDDSVSDLRVLMDMMKLKTCA